MGKLIENLLKLQTLVEAEKEEKEKDEEETEEKEAEETEKEEEEETEEKEEKESDDESEEKSELSKAVSGLLENKPRLSEAILSLLNTQIKNELQSSQIYKGVSCWLDDNGWIGASKYYFKSAAEELTHMDKIYQYLFDRNCKAVVPTCDEVKQDFKDIREIVEFSLEHEMEVSKQWEEISKKAKEENDSTTHEMAEWFLKEQVEEEEKFRNILFKMNLDMPKWKVDELFEQIK